MWLCCSSSCRASTAAAIFPSSLLLALWLLNLPVSCVGKVRGQGRKKERREGREREGRKREGRKREGREREGRV